MMKSVLFVFLGNISRSPACDGVARHTYGNLINGNSAGTAGYHSGESPDSRSIEACRMYGVNNSSQ